MSETEAHIIILWQLTTGISSYLRRGSALPRPSSVGCVFSFPFPALPSSGAPGRRLSEMSWMSLYFLFSCVTPEWVKEYGVCRKWATVTRTLWTWSHGECVSQSSSDPPALYCFISVYPTNQPCSSSIGPLSVFFIFASGIADHLNHPGSVFWSCLCFWLECYWNTITLC